MDDTLPVIDWELAIKMAGQKKELAEEILNLLLASLPTDMATIKALYQAKNYPELQKQVHKLHGALCYCGLPRLKSVTALLETALKNNIMSSLPSLFDQLDVEATSLLELYPRQPS